MVETQKSASRFSVEVRPMIRRDLYHVITIEQLSLRYSI